MLEDCGQEVHSLYMTITEYHYIIQVHVLNHKD